MEVYYNGEWGTVCDDGWDDIDATVVCRQLGLGPIGTSYNSDRFGQAPGPIWLDNVQCTGNESTLASCSHLGVNNTRSCTHYEDAGVRCYGGQGTNSSIYFLSNLLVTLYLTTCKHPCILVYTQIFLIKN